MQNNKYLFTSESVSEGHPDKVCDRISDMVVDTYIAGDPFSRVACETLTTTNKVVLAGETRGPKIKKDEIHIVGNKKIKSMNIKTAPYPGFPTDLQAQIMVLLCKANKQSLINNFAFDFFVAADCRIWCLLCIGFDFFCPSRQACYKNEEYLQ